MRVVVRTLLLVAWLVVVAIYANTFARSTWFGQDVFGDAFRVGIAGGILIRRTWRWILGAVCGGAAVWTATLAIVADRADGGWDGEGYAYAVASWGSTWSVAMAVGVAVGVKARHVAGFLLRDLWRAGRDPAAV